MLMTLLLLAQDRADSHHLAVVARVEHPGSVLYEISYTPTGVHRAYLEHQRCLPDTLMELPEMALSELDAQRLLTGVFGDRLDLAPALTPALVS